MEQNSAHFTFSSLILRELGVTILGIFELINKNGYPRLDQKNIFESWEPKYPKIPPLVPIHLCDNPHLTLHRRFTLHDLIYFVFCKSDMSAFFIGGCWRHTRCYYYRVYFSTAFENDTPTSLSAMSGTTVMSSFVVVVKIPIKYYWLEVYDPL